MAGNHSGPSRSKNTNVLLNHDFSGGLNSWHLNCCNGYVIEAGSQGGVSMGKDGNYAVITDRKECWQGLEQDITDRISIGSTYMVSACVGVSGLSQGSADVLATLKLEYHDKPTSYLFIGRYRILSFRCFISIIVRKLRKMLTLATIIFYRTSVVKDSWEKLEGKFSLSMMPDRVIFYLEGPAPGVDLLIQLVEINCSSPNDNVCHVIIYLNTVMSLSISTYWQSNFLMNFNLKLVHWLLLLQ